MRKWTYLVAALLMSGTAATFTSCIDTTEPAGIEALRGAKAELLQAKAQVELAEAQKKLADAEYKKALAAIKQEKAKQQALRTALMAEKNEKKIAKIKQEMELSAAQHRQNMAAALAAAEEAEMHYQQTLIDIELALLGYKENEYANELKNLLTTTTFKYTSETFEFVIINGEYQYDQYGNIKYNIKKENKEINGYYDLIRELSEGRRKLADFNRELIDLSLKFDYKDLKKDNQARIDYYQGLIDADTKLLDEYKKIGDLDITAWETEYEALKTKIETAEEAQTAIDDKLANDLLPYQEKQREIDAKKTEDKEYTFTFSKEISATVKNALEDLVKNYNGKPSLDASKKLDKDYFDNQIISQSVLDEDGNRVFENGLKLTLNLDEFNILVNSDEDYTGTGGGSVFIKGLLPTIKSIYESLDDNTAQGSADNKQNLIKLKTNMDDAMNAYNDEIDIWKPLHDEFISKANIYKYNFKEEEASRKYDSRNEIIKKLNEYNALTTEEKDDAANIKKYADEFAKYLKERNELDGWNPVYDATDSDNPVYYKDELANTDAAKQKAAFTAFLALAGDDDRFGTAVLDATTDDESLYAKLIASAKKIWGENKYSASSSSAPTVTPFGNDELAAMVEFDLEEWEEQDDDAIEFLTELYNDAGYSSTSLTFSTTLLGDGLANDRFVSEYLYNQLEDKELNHENYGNFLAELEKLVEAYKATIEEIDQATAENSNAMAALQSTAEQEKAKYTREIGGYDDLMKIMATVIDRDDNTIANNDINANNTIILQALVKIKNAIVNIEGGVEFEIENGEIVQKVPVEGNDYYVYGSLVTNKAWITYYENINKGLDDGTYTVEGMYDVSKEAIEVNIKVKEAEIETLEALYNQATKKKDELLKVITGSTATE